MNEPGRTLSRMFNIVDRYRAEREAIRERQDGICPLCGKRIEPYAKFEIDHEWAKGRGGPDTDDNKRAVHAACHTEKTKGDVKEIAKTKRQAAKHEAHEEAIRTRTKRPNAKERQRRKWAERRLMPLAPRQE